MNTTHGGDMNYHGHTLQTFVNHRQMFVCLIDGTDPFLPDQASEDNAIMQAKLHIGHSIRARGGSRKGAGRPAGRDHKSINISLPMPMINYLKTLPAGNRSKWIAKAIDMAIALDGIE